jgi:hypothetical protein
MGMEWRDWHRDKKIDWDKGGLVDARPKRTEEVNVLPHIIVGITIVLALTLLVLIFQMM